MMPRKRWLIVRNGGIGDTILLSPLIQSIRKSQPDAWIEVMGIRERVELLVGEGLADNAVSYEQYKTETLYFTDSQIDEDLRNYLAQFGYILYFGGKDIPRLQSRLTVRERQEVVVHPALPEPQAKTHITKHYLNAARYLIPINEPAEPKVYVSDNDVISVIKELEKRFDMRLDNRFLLALHPGASGKTKQAPVNRILDEVQPFLHENNLAILLTEGPTDGDANQALMQQLPTGVPVLLLEDYSLKEIASALKTCQRFIGSDCGITHLAAAVGTPTTALFTTTDPAVWSPLGKHVKTVHLRDKK